MLLNDPPPHPAGLSDDSPYEDVMDAMRDKLMQHCQVPQHIDDRRSLWKQQGDLFGGPRAHAMWLTLQPDQRLQCWQFLLENELQMDIRALQSFVELLNHPQQRLGYQECCRILAHLLKDTADGGWASSSSAWLNKSCLEARRAIENYDEWNLGAAKGASKGSSGPREFRHRVPRGRFGAASSSSAPSDADTGYDRDWHW